MRLILLGTILTAILGTTLYQVKIGIDAREASLLQLERGHGGGVGQHIAAPGQHRAPLRAVERARRHQLQLQLLLFNPILSRQLE